MVDWPFRMAKYSLFGGIFIFLSFHRPFLLCGKMFLIGGCMGDAGEKTSLVELAITFIEH